MSGSHWWGWGEGGHGLPPAAVEALVEALGAGAASPAVEPQDVHLPEPALPERARARLAAAVGGAHVGAGQAARLAHAAGKGYPDLVRLRAGRPAGAPDAVVSPASHDEVAAVLSVCTAERVAVVPFGGGTSVVGGVEPLRGEHGAVIALDLGRLGRVLAIDRHSLLATVEPGIRGPALEAALAAEGLTLGHFPQSFERSTLGGWVATRSAGQASTGYGRIDELVRGLRLATPAGELAARAFPASAAGPSLRELAVGSEGALGVITAATVEVHPAPAKQRYEGWLLGSLEAGVEVLRELAQADVAPTVARLSDEAETRLRAAEPREGCLLIAGWEGERLSRRRHAERALRSADGVALGARPGGAWLRGRYSGPYVRDQLLDRGILVETVETATSWAGLLDLYGSVRSALPGIVLCHVSHVYATGASLYFTVLARQEPGSEIAQWEALKAASLDAIAAGGGTVTHHHAIGRDHAGRLGGEIGGLGIDLLRAAKGVLDPAGIMNPGKLLG